MTHNVDLISWFFLLCRRCCPIKAYACSVDFGLGIFSLKFNFQHLSSQNFRFDIKQDLMRCGKLINGIQQRSERKLVCWWTVIYVIRFLCKYYWHIRQNIVYSNIRHPINVCFSFQHYSIQTSSFIKAYIYSGLFIFPDKRVRSQLVFLLIYNNF